ncbi:hypothetical protein [Alkalihalobacterium chitinilyticum]|uniref:DUF4179 domain-containing protein n=1 Tax=Alkalihalobacterium chitinilyticum TaxID=2980103 RepID=A0ABT5VH97_9BACI|nr:hypothetical protein [Alkalihalobacterium chitinilyticum]MDE5414814.1 hypothetical protein [Alkalihalobacterium chitinilyticum]
MNIEDRIRKHKIKHKPDYNKIWYEIQENESTRNARKYRFKFPKKMVVAPLLVFIVALGIGSHSILAQKLQELPYIGSVFNYLGDEGIKKALDQGDLVLVEDTDLKYVDLVDQPEILSAVMDGSKVYVSFIIAKNDFNELNSEELNLKFNNEYIELFEFSYDLSYADSQNFIVYMTGKLPLNHNSDNENFIAVSYQEEDYIVKPHTIKKVDNEVYKIALKEEIDSVGSIYFHYVNLSPLAVELRFRVTSNQELNEDILSFEVYDAHGNYLDPLFDSMNPTVGQIMSTEDLYQYSYTLRYTPSEYTDFIKVVPFFNKSSLNELLLDLDYKNLLQ